MLAMFVPVLVLVPITVFAVVGFTVCMITLGVALSSNAAADYDFNEREKIHEEGDQ